MKFRKKPVVIEAVKWEPGFEPTPWFVDAFTNGVLRARGSVLLIKTLEGVVQAKDGDYIVQGVEGELYPCRANIFHKTYEEVV